MKYEVKIEGDEKLMADLKMITSQLNVGVEEVLDTTALEAKSALKSNAPSFTGELKESIDVFARTKGERKIGPGAGTIGSDYPPAHYGKYVEEGGGPVASYPNVEDIALRMGIDLKQAFAFARYLRDTGRGVRQASWFFRDVSDQVLQMFDRNVQSLLSRITR